MSGVEWLGQAGTCPAGWTALPNNVCTRLGEGGWPEYRCANGYFTAQTGGSSAPTCTPIPNRPLVPVQPAPTPRKGSVVPALAALGVALGIFYAVVR